MNIWEHQAAVAAGKLVADALPVAKKVAEAAAHEVKVEAPKAEGFAEKALHAVEHALHIGTQEAQTAQPQAEASATQAPAAAPQDAQAPAQAPQGAEDRKAALLAELHKLEDDVQHLGD